jgi:RNA-binding protein NOB1
MQNVALQMGLTLVAPDGLRITRLQRWVLRCHACNGVTRDAGRHFCGRCGNAALQRVSLTVDSSGVEHVGVRRRHNLRGTRYSLPAPQGGRYALNPVLREDQLAMRREPSRGNKPRPESDEFAAELGPEAVFARAQDGRHTAPSLASAGEAPVVGRMRNPNVRCVRCAPLLPLCAQSDSDLGGCAFFQATQSEQPERVDI